MSQLTQPRTELEVISDALAYNHRTFLLHISPREKDIDVHTMITDIALDRQVTKDEVIDLLRNVAEYGDEAIKEFYDATYRY